jgi:putative cardiolipin synthase
VRALANGQEAFSARVLLARQAQDSIDVQYYIWQKDATGLILLDELRAAAERGVRVRLLLDDNGIKGLDEILSGLDALPQVEVRLWNPFTIRSPKALGYLFDFPRLNRRMHNKSFTVDGIATIVGGRNIGDIYFAYGPDVHYVDLDALAVGPAAVAVSEEFDRYWSSSSSYPARLILPPASGGLPLLSMRAAAAWSAPETVPYADAVAQTPFIRSIESGEEIFNWVPVTLLSDDPAKGLGQAGHSGLLLTRLLAEVGEPSSELDIVSAYFVPGTAGTDALARLQAQGVRVRVLTNAWEATDVVLVHAGYIRSRGALLRAGVDLLERRASATAPKRSAVGADLTGSGVLSSSSASLHAKTMVFDRERIFVGSFNFDRRSAHLNTEMGMLIDSPSMAAAVAARMDEVAPKEAYKVGLTADGKTEWIAGWPDGTENRLTTEPGTTFLGRLGVTAVTWMPIEWLL